MKTKKALLILVGLTLTFSIGILVYSQRAVIQPKMLLIYALIGIVAIISIGIAFKKMNEEKEGQPLDDEFTMHIKYKAGFYGYIGSLYMWLFLFLFRDFFPDTETLVGGGILLSGVIGFTSKMIVKNQLDEK
jgi:magnesium-transporting ATPase (P-type)